MTNLFKISIAIGALLLLLVAYLTYTNHGVCGWEQPLGKSWPCKCVGIVSKEMRGTASKSYCTGLNLSHSDIMLKFQSQLQPNTQVPLPNKPSVNPSKYQGPCESNNGVWLAEYNECGRISQTKCEEIGGTFNECASPCRNDPEAQVCIMSCEQVCQF